MRRVIKCRTQCQKMRFNETSPNYDDNNGEGSDSGSWRKCV